MTDAHALLQAAWDTADLAPLLILADLLDERADPDGAELIRLTVAEANTTRPASVHTRRLRQLREQTWTRARTTGWPDMAMQGDTSAVNFSRRPDPAVPDRETIAVRPAWGTIHRLLARVEGDDEVIRSGAGAELLRRRLPPSTADFIRRGGDPWGASLAFTLEHDYFPLPPGWQGNRAPALAVQQARVIATLAPAAIPVADLPGELLPLVAWVLAEYLTSRTRRARGGEPVPGAHVFLFHPDPGRWRHSAALGPHESGRGTAILRERVRWGWGHGRGAVAGLLVRVAAMGRVAARKLVWVVPNGDERESQTLLSAAAGLPPGEFRRAAGELRLDAATAGQFIVDTPDRLRGLFGPPG